MTTDFTSDLTRASSGETGALSEDGDLGEEVHVSATDCQSSGGGLHCEARHTASLKLRRIQGERSSGLELVVVFRGKSEILSAAGDRWGKFPSSLMPRGDGHGVKDKQVRMADDQLQAVISLVGSVQEPTRNPRR